MSHRNPKVLGVWGDDGTRVIASEAKWKEPMKWDRKAREAGERRRVFCASIADVFEDRPELVEPRIRLRWLMYETPNLDWLLLTKRPDVAARWFDDYLMPVNVWAGTSVEDQATADERIPHLLQIPAAVRFVSAEPLLGPVDLDAMSRAPGAGDDLTEEDYVNGPPLSGIDGIDWVIVGGESGPGARPMHPKWARAIRDQCVQAGVPFFFKQWGEWAPMPEPFDYQPGYGSGNREYVRALDRYAREHGASRLLDDRPEGWDRAMVEQGTCILDGGLAIGRVGKKAAGRILDGVEWSQFPEASRCD